MEQAVIKSVLNLDIAQFKAGIQSASDQSGGMEKKFSGLKTAIAGAFSVSAISSFIKETFRVADAIDDMSARTGLAAETVQTLGVISNEAGVSMGTFESSILKMTRSQAEAQSGNKNLQAAFEHLGISLEELSGLSPDQLFDRVTKSLASNAGNAAATAAAYDILGKGAGTALNELRKLGEEGVENVNKRLLDQNQILSNDTVKNLADAELAWTRATTAAKNFGISLVGGLAKFSEDLYVGLDALGKTNEELKQIAETEQWLVQKAAEKAQKEKEKQALMEMQRAIEDEMLKYDKAQAEHYAATVTNEEKLADLKQRALEAEQELRNLYGEGDEARLRRIRLETELLQTGDEIAKIEKTLADEVLKKQDEEKKNLKKTAEEYAKIEKELAEEVFKKQAEEKERLKKISEEFAAAEKELTDYLTAKWWDALEPQQQLEELKLRQLDAEDQLRTMEEQGLQNTAGYVKLLLDVEKKKDDVLKVEKELAAKSGESATNMGSVADEAKNSKNGISELSSEIGKLNRFELGNLITNMKLLQSALKSIAAEGGFPDIKLPDLKNFTIPEWMRDKSSVDQVRNFIAALRELFTSLSGATDFSKIGQALNFKMPDTSKTDLPGLAEVLRASKNAQYGELSIQVSYPKEGIPVDPRGLNLASISQSLQTIAAMKGVIFA